MTGKVRALDADFRTKCFKVVDQILEPKRRFWDGTLTMAAKVIPDTGKAILKTLNKFRKGCPAGPNPVNEKKGGTLSFDRISAVDCHV